ncbi:MAG TPA: terminase [Myxococcales bacterium]|nr:terminase [Myxococcales bacterium]
MRKQLLSWQWGLYPENHTTRANLLIHIFTVPLFIAGTLTLLLSPMYGLRPAVSGLVAMVAAVALQGRGHRSEPVVPVPFLGPLDFVSRFFCEQFVNFPRYVLSGGWAQALRKPRS